MKHLICIFSLWTVCCSILVRRKLEIQCAMHKSTGQKSCKTLFHPFTYYILEDQVCFVLSLFYNWM